MLYNLGRKLSIQLGYTGPPLRYRPNIRPPTNHSYQHPNGFDLPVHEYGYAMSYNIAWHMC
jgi:hypothetical protein